MYLYISGKRRVFTDFTTVFDSIRLNHVDEIRQSPFTIKEASEYLEVAEITVRRWVKSKKLRQEGLAGVSYLMRMTLKGLKSRINNRDEYVDKTGTRCGTILLSIFVLYFPFIR